MEVVQKTEVTAEVVETTAPNQYASYGGQIAEGKQEESIPDVPVPVVQQQSLDIEIDVGDTEDTGMVVVSPVHMNRQKSLDIEVSVHKEKEEEKETNRSTQVKPKKGRGKHPKEKSEKSEKSLSLKTDDVKEPIAKTKPNSNDKPKDLSDQGHQGQDQDQETLGDDGNDKPKDRENSPTAVKSASAVKSRERSVEKTKPNNNNNKPNNNKPNNNKPKERENSPVKSIVKSRSVKKEKEDKEEREKGKEGQYKDQQKEKEDKEERRVEPAPSAEVVTDPVKVALLAMSPGFITDAVRMKELRFLDTNYANVSVSEFANSTSEGVEHLCTDFSTARGWNCILEMFFSIIYLDYSWFQRDYFYTNYGGKEWFFNKATKKGFIERFFDWEGDVVIMPLDERVSLGSYISILLASYLMWSGILDSSHVLLSYPTMTIA